MLEHVEFVSPARVATVSITDTLDHPDLLGPWFSGQSWATWRVVLRAAFGLPLDEANRALFRALAERDPPTTPCRELWAIAGRRAGKDSIASAIATHFALFGNFAPYLRPGERASVLCLACDRQQARIVLRYIKGYFTKIPMLGALVERETAEGLDLNNGVEIIVATNSFRTVRGRSLACVIFDECAYWRDEHSATPDIEVYNAILPGLTNLPGAMLIGISSPYRRGGLLFDRWRQCYGRDRDDVLVVKGPSRAFNPTIDQRTVDAAIERDPEAAAAEWLGEWRRDITAFVERAVIDAAVVTGRHELPPITGTSYVAFVDPSGGSADSMTLAIGHRQGDCAVLDCIRERRPPFSPEAVVADFAETLRSYGLATVTGDRYGGEWPRERFRQHGIEYTIATQSKSDLYLSFLPLLNSGRIELLDHARTLNQLANLERRTARGGRDFIDHGPGQHDDIINSVAGCAVTAARPAQTALFACPIIVTGSRGDPHFASDSDTTSAYYASLGL